MGFGFDSVYAEEDKRVVTSQTKKPKGTSFKIVLPKTRLENGIRRGSKQRHGVLRTILDIRSVGLYRLRGGPF